nr:vezatin [Ciona intestinalis]|eukprot:XP_002126508.1 vezatin [Ciona intestinalis]
MPELSSVENEKFSIEEDVVLEGTPLYEYLQDLDLIEPHHQNERRNSSIKPAKQGFWYGTSFPEYFRLQMEELRRKCSHIFPLSEDVLVDMSRHFHSRYGSEILQSKVILEDDLDYLCIQTPQQFLNAINSNEIKKPTKHASKSGHNSFRYSAMVVLVVACFISFFFSTLPTFPQSCLAIIALGVICFNVRLEIIIEMWKRKHEGNLHALNRFLCISAQLHSQIKRSIRLIQEVEVVSRGYKLVNGTTPISRIELMNRGSARMFMKLRYNVMRSIVKCTLVCRTATNQLLEYSLQDSCDLEEYFICKVPLSKLGVCFMENSTPSEMFNATDGYSLSALKCLNELLCKQRSEMLTRLSLTLSGTTWDFTSHGFLSRFTSILDQPNTVTADSLQSLQCSYDMHKYVTNTKNIPQQSQGEGQPCKTSVLRINLHSLQVHMRAAMHAAMQLEESLPLDNTQVQLPDNFINIGRHLESGLDCWAQFNKEISGFEENESEKEETENIVQPVVTEDEELVVVDNTDDEVTMEDQIFEAIADDSSDEDYDRGDMFDSRPTKIVEDTATVMRELRSVLAVKTSEKEREMWKMKLFPGYKGKKVEDQLKNEELSIEEKSNNPEENCEVDIVDTSDQSVSCDLNNINNSKLKGDDLEVDPQASDTLNGEIRSQMLSFPKRSAPKGRRPPTNKRAHNTRNGVVTMPTIESQSTSTDSDDNQTDPDWTSGLGIGFPGAIALQAAAMARSKQIGCGQITTYGSDSDSS